MPAQPWSTACLVSLTVSMIEQQPVPGIMRDGSIPAAISSSSNSARSSIDNEFASLFVPNTASPQFCDSNHLQCAMNRWLSGERSDLNGVTTGASTPRILSVMILQIVFLQAGDLHKGAKQSLFQRLIFMDRNHDAFASSRHCKNVVATVNPSQCPTTPLNH